MVSVLVNILILSGELAAIVGVAALAYQLPIPFALVTSTLIVLIGAYLEYARLSHELPFYLGRPPSAGRKLMVWVLAATTTFAKAIGAALVALMTFSGTDPDRQFIVGVVFGLVLFFGTSVLRRLSISFNVYPERWGYFRLALPLGLAYAVCLAVAGKFGFLKTPTESEIARQIFIETPPKPSLGQASELLFQLKQYIDSLLLKLFTTLTTPDIAEVASIVVSANVLVGMVLAVYVVVITGAVRRAEQLS